MGPDEFFVVIPMYNEEKGVEDTLHALAAQSDTGFTLVVVDNGSTDDSIGVVNRVAASLPALRLQVIQEPQKGSGAAADTGFRHAIASGARWIARTDADCLPTRTWVAQIKRAFGEQQLEFVVGKLRPRDDEYFTRFERVRLRLVLWLAEHYGGTFRFGKQFRYPYIMVPGGNLAMTADLYVRCGGFPRTRMDDVMEDRVISEKIRTMTSRAALLPDLIVQHSARRLRAWGYLKTLRFYRNHGYRPPVVDIR
jgi:glycosyltransferase involved in cell wall biosynthesis